MKAPAPDQALHLKPVALSRRRPILSSGTCVLVLLVLVGGLTGCGAFSKGAPRTFYVDPARGNDSFSGDLSTPFLSLEHAQIVARKRLREVPHGDVVICLRGGTYALTRPLTFDARDSGPPGAIVSYEAYPQEQPVISGGKTIGGWTLHDPARSIWQTGVDAGDDFRQLYVNGKKAAWTRHAAPENQPDAAGYLIHDPALQQLKNSSDIEVVTRPHLWEEERLRVASITATHLLLQKPGLKIVTTGEYPRHARIAWLENAYEWLTEPGTWYLDRAAHRLYYRPRPGEDMNTATVEAPLLERLFYFHGSSARPVSNLRISGLTFRLTTWLEPSRGIGLLSAQANQLTFNQPAPGEIGCPVVEAAVGGTGLRHVVIENCTFYNLGGQGVNVLLASRNSTIQHCEFSDVVAGAIQVGAVGPQVAQLPVGSPEIVSNITIADCTVHHVSTEYRSGCGIFLGYVQGCTVAHNDIHDVPYTAISLGWGWTEKAQAAAYRTDNLIEGNRIHDYMMELDDGGGIYCNGYETSGIIRNNYLYDPHRFSSALYLDDGSTHWNVTANVCAMGALSRPWLLYKGANEYVHGNFTDTSVLQNLTLPQDAPSRVEGTSRVIGADWPPAAQAIKDASGPRPR